MAPSFSEGVEEQALSARLRVTGPRTGGSRTPITSGRRGGSSELAPQTLRESEALGRSTGTVGAECPQGEKLDTNVHQEEAAEMHSGWPS